MAEFFLLRGFKFTHETVRDWEERFAPIFAQQLRAKRKGRVSTSWYVDETYIRIKGKWCYVYRAIDRDGFLVDSMLSEKRDMDATQPAFFTGSACCNWTTRARNYGWAYGSTQSHCRGGAELMWNTGGNVTA